MADGTGVPVAAGFGVATWACASIAIHARASEAIKAATTAINLGRVFIFIFQSQRAGILEGQSKPLVVLPPKGKVGVGRCLMHYGPIDAMSPDRDN